VTVSRRQPPSSPSSYDTDDKEAFPPSTPPSTPPPTEPQDPFTSPPHTPRTPPPPSPLSSPMQDIEESSVVVVSPEPVRLLPQVPQVPRLALPPVPQLLLPPRPVSLAPRPPSQGLPPKARPTPQARRTLQPIDDRTAIALERVPRQRAIQKKRRAQPLNKRASRGKECKLCNKYLPTLKHYKDHLKTKAHQRKEINKDPFDCKTCDQKFYSIEDYRRHLQSKGHRTNQSLSR